MRRYFKAAVTFIVLVLASVLTLSCAQGDEYVVISGYAQGGTYAVKFNLNGKDGRVRQAPEEIRDSIDAMLLRIDRSLSGYNKNSILSRFNAGESVCLDELFYDLYEKSYAVYEDTDGVVDVASAPLFDIWGFGFSKGEMPDDKTVEAVKAVSGMSRLSRDIRSCAGADGSLAAGDVVLDGGMMPKLNFNAVAQGYSCDVIASYLYSIGVKDMLVDIGEFFCDGLNPSGKPWTIGIDRPIDGNNDVGAQLQGVFRAPSGPHGIVTSGNYRKFYVKDGKKYAHTIDPRSGRPVEHSLLSATVVAPDAMTADAYATWCMVVGLEEAKAFLSGTEGFEGCLIYDDCGQMKSWCSPGFVLEEL
jgi:thiamine biosynthesis lipoprotein